MNKKPRLTRAELNELAWQKKKKKKRTHGNKSGSRSNEGKLELQVAKDLQKQAQTQERVVRAIPLNIPGRATPLVSPKLADSVLEPKSSNPQPGTTAPTPSSSTTAVDMVIRNGKLVSAAEIELEHKRAARKARREEAKAQAATKSTKTNPEVQEKSVKLGKAALRRLEREAVALGEDLDFFEQQKSKKSKTLSQVEEPTGKIYQRDYKAGRNTDYSKTQAQAEKSLAEIRKSKNKKKLSGEELLDA